MARAQTQAQSGFGRAIVLFSRALLLRCPVCGSSGIFQAWFRLEERCPGCRFVFGRAKVGHQFVAMTLNLIIPFLVWSVAYFVILVMTWSDPPWAWLKGSTVVLMLALPLLHYPVSHALAIALEVLFHPPKRR
jgi:uncharacterized protein (DUF983 family)